jgi:REP element-mobilizing transposase RayT
VASTAEISSCDDGDRDVFCGLLRTYLKQFGYQCLAWSLLSNHYHLVLRASDRALGELMKPLNSRYARWYGKKYGRRGYLFQDRYKSIVTSDQKYVEELVRYVHLNPIRAGICPAMDSLDGYRWCGHSALMGKQRCGFQDTAQVLRRFGKDAASVKAAIEKDRYRRAEIASHAAKGWNLDRLANYIAGKVDVSTPELKKRGRATSGSRARMLMAYLGYAKLGISQHEIGAYLKVTGSAVSQMAA